MSKTKITKSSGNRILFLETTEKTMSKPTRSVCSTISDWLSLKSTTSVTTPTWCPSARTSLSKTLPYLNLYTNLSSPNAGTRRELISTALEPSSRRSVKSTQWSCTGSNANLKGLLTLIRNCFPETLWSRQICSAGRSSLRFLWDCLFISTPSTQWSRHSKHLSGSRSCWTFLKFPSSLISGRFNCTKKKSMTCCMWTKQTLTRFSESMPKILLPLKTWKTCFCIAPTPP